VDGGDGLRDQAGPVAGARRRADGTHDRGGQGLGAGREDRRPVVVRARKEKEVWKKDKKSQKIIK